MSAREPQVERSRELVDDREVLNLSRQMIRIPSQSKSEQRVSKFIFGKLEKWGLSPKLVKVEGYGPNVTAEIGDRDASAVAFNGHMDTVAVADGWKHKPYGAAIEKGMLYGLGSLDMKCGLAGLMLAFRALAEDGIPRRSRVLFQAVTGEEDNSAGTRALLSRGAMAKTKAVIVGEGFGGLEMVTIGRRGGYYWDINVTGKAAHGASPHLGINAVSDAAKIVCALDGLALRKHKDYVADDGTPLAESQTVLRIRGGMDTLSVPERCYIKVIRCPLPGGPVPEQVQKDLEGLVKSLHLRSKVDFTLQDKPGDLFLPHVTPPDSSLVRVSSACIKGLTGRSPRLVIGRSEADDNIVARELDVPIVCFGPGESGLLARYHQAEEAVHVNQLGDAARAYYLTAGEVCRRLST